MRDGNGAICRKKQSNRRPLPPRPWIGLRTAEHWQPLARWVLSEAQVDTSKEPKSTEIVSLVENAGATYCHQKRTEPCVLEVCVLLQLEPVESVELLRFIYLDHTAHLSVSRPGCLLGQVTEVLLGGQGCQGLLRAVRRTTGAAEGSFLLARCDGDLPAFLYSGAGRAGTLGRASGASHENLLRPRRMKPKMDSVL